MNHIRNRFYSLSPRVRWIALGAVIAIGAILVLARNKSTESGRAGSASSAANRRDESAGATSGMPGMKMSSDGAVSLTAAQLQQFGVTFDLVALRPLSNEVRTVGTVMVDETRVTKVAPKFPGYVERLLVNFVGQAVRRGQPLAEIFSPDLLAAEQELLLAARLTRSIEGSTVPGVQLNNTDLVGAARQRLRLWDVSEAQINQVVRTGRPIRTVTLYSPSSGVVTEKKVVQGQAVQPGEELYTITDLSNVWIEAQLREGDAAAVAPGASAVIELAGYPGRAHTGRVTYIYPVLNTEARTITARIVVPNPDGRIKPGMYATVRLNTATQSALTVPRSAVVETGERAIVFVDMGNRQLSPRQVRLGRRGSDYVEVLSGLQAGQRVVTSAQFLLDSESNLAEVMRSMVGSGTMTGMKNMPPAASENMNDRGADMRGMPGMTTPSKRK